MIVKDPTRGVRLAILGDFHYNVDDDELYQKAKHQILELSPDAVVCLGDLGRGATCGSSASFKNARDFFLEFQKPYYPVIGNHDLESNEFKTDQEAVQKWLESFDLHNAYYAVDLEHTLLLFLSSVYHRDNKGSPHEVCLDQKQIEWFQESVEQNKDRPIFVFSHAPILGSHLKIIQNLHLKVPNAWINHSNNPGQFIEIVHKNPQIKLWFSAHNHLGQYYKDSVSQVNKCLFVHTGVIGTVTRDGFHHSRFLEFGDQGCVLSTIDHTMNQCSVDTLYDFNNDCVETYTKFTDCKSSSFYSPTSYPTRETYKLGDSTFDVHQNDLVEFDSKTKDALGVVEQKMQKKSFKIEGDNLYICLHNGEQKKVIRNGDGRFFSIFFPSSKVIQK